MSGQKVIKVIGGIVLASLVVFITFFKRVDHLPLSQQPYYALALKQLDNNQTALAKDGVFKVGWGKRNITPSQPTHLMGYGWKGNYQQVHDSLWVRSLVFQLDTLTIGLVTYDLMLAPPLVVRQVQTALTGSDIDHLYFSATHTHKGYGGWEQGLGREIISGWHDDDLVQSLVNKTIASLQDAYQQALPSTIAYAQFNLDSLVNNRLIKNGEVEPFLRIIYFRRQDSSQAILSSFSAHATFVTSKSKDLSADYPGELVRQLEASQSVDFALFAAGAVGSHSPHKPGVFSYQKLQTYANRLATPLLQAIDGVAYDSADQLSFSEIELPLGEAQLRITSNWRVRPSWFQQILGRQKPTVSFLQLGEITLVGTPGDFSGLLYPRIESEGKPLIVTSFNGEYIGYLIPSEYYHLNHRETRSINWYGPYTGDYTTEIINKYLSTMK
ncbi:MAG: neutral/alkaline non-lysosomal ceramidase N-terminal domain-containing protein [Bacteroidota bacterium]